MVMFIILHAVNIAYENTKASIEMTKKYCLCVEQELIELISFNRNEY